MSYTFAPIVVCGNNQNNNQLRSRDNTHSHRRRPTLCSRSPLCCGRFRSTAAASDLLRPLPLHCGRSPHYCGRFCSTAAASDLLRPLPLHCGRSPHCCGRSMSDSDCVRSMFRSGVHLWATIVLACYYMSDSLCLDLRN